jgi:nucleotide-binding universal stress UspA family protein
MMSETGQRHIVVGVSGSRASVAALRWAADEARRRHAGLRAICAWDPSLRPASYANVGAGNPTENTRARAGGLAAAVRAAFGPVRPACLHTELAEGVPERVLIARSAGADLLVLGLPRLQDAAGLSVGPVLRTCLVRARCPVVVVSAGATQESAGATQETEKRPDEARPARVSALAG